MESRVAIVVLNYNDSENTIRFVNEIRDYSILYKIIIVDNNSTKTDEYEKLNKLSSEKIVVIKSDKNGGYSYGNNFGIRYLEENSIEVDYVIISNPDISIEQTAIEECIKFLQENKDVAIVAPRMHYVSGPARRSAWKNREVLVDVANSTRITELLLYPFFKGAEYTKKDFEEKRLKVENISGAFFVADYNKFKEVGFFDENVFLFFEEDILGSKLNKKGYDIYSLNDINFMHYDSKTIGKLMNMFKKQDIMFDSRIYFHKNYNNAARIQIFLFKILRYIRKFELLFEVPIRRFIEKK